MAEKRELSLDSRLLKKGDDKEALKSELINSRVLNRVREVLEARVVVKEATTEQDYSIPNWSHLQADRAGYIRAMTDVLKLINKK